MFSFLHLIDVCLKSEDLTLQCSNEICCLGVGLPLYTPVMIDVHTAICSLFTVH